MLETFVTERDLYNVEPIIEKLLESRQGEVDIKDLMESSLNRLKFLVKHNRGYKLRLLCTRLNLLLNTESSIDYIERNRLVLNISSVTTSTVFVLEGSKDKSSWTRVVDGLTVTETGSYNVLLKGELLKYYRISKDVGDALFSEAYLVETTFDLPYEYLSLHICFEKLNALTNDVYHEKAIHYWNMFTEILGSINPSIDVDDDDDIDTDDKTSNTGIVTIHR